MIASICYDPEQFIKQLSADGFRDDDPIRFPPLVSEKKDEKGKAKFEPFADPKHGFPWIIVKFNDLKTRLRSGETLETITGVNFNPKAGVYYGINPCTDGTDKGVTRDQSILIESDDESIEKQLEIIKASGLKYTSLTLSGGKSIHAHCPIEVSGKKDRKKIFANLLAMLKPFGFTVDPANSNMNRLTRAAGCYRGDQKQELIEVKENIEPYKLPPEDSYTSSSSSPKSRSKKAKAKAGNLSDNKSLILHALERILDPKDLDYDAWFLVLCVCKYEGIEFETFDEWCKEDPERYNLEVNRSKWDGANTDPENLVRFGSFCELVREFDPEFNAPKSEKSGKPSKAQMVLEDCQHALRMLHACLLNESLLYVYDQEKGYVGNPPIIRQKIAHLFNGNKRPQEVGEILKYLEDNAPQKEEPTENLIQFKNCIVKVGEKSKEKDIEILDRSPEWIIKNTIPWTYDTSYPWAYEPLTGMVVNDKGERNLKAEFVEKILDDWMCGNVEMKTLLLECIGQTMLTTVPIHGFFLLIGTGRNGKSVFCDLLRVILGFSNTSSLPLKELNGRFSGEGLVGKLANIVEENAGKWHEEQTVLKNISAGGMLKLEGKGKPITQVRCTSTQVFSYNQDFRIDDSSGALRPRTNAILFNADFSDPKKQDPDLWKKLSDPDCVQYVIQKSIEAISKAVKRGEFTKPAESVEWVERQTEMNDSYHVIPFLRALKDGVDLDYEGQSFYAESLHLKGLDEERLYENDVDDLYKAYCNWCKGEKLEAASKPIWSRNMCKHENLTTIQTRVTKNDKRVRVRYYVKKEG